MGCDIHRLCTRTLHVYCTICISAKSNAKQSALTDGTNININIKGPYEKHGVKKFPLQERLQ